MQYRHLQYWIKWQAKKLGVLAQYVNPNSSSVYRLKSSRTIKRFLSSV